MLSLATHSRTRRLRLAVALPVCLIATAPAVASASTRMAPATPTPYNATPDCPVSAAAPVCGPWNVPVDQASPFGPQDYGQCTYWAAAKYPSLVTNESPSDPLGGDWDASTWVEHAEREGVAVTTTPAAGDLAVWAGDPDDPPGHVAYVELVNADGSIVVSQMNGDSSDPEFPSLQGSTEYLTSEELQYSRQTLDLRYIEGDPDTGTPAAYVELPAGRGSRSERRAQTESEPLAPHYTLHGSALAISVTVAVQPGRMQATATRAKQTVRLTSARYGDHFSLGARLSRGRWTVRLVYSPSDGVTQTGTLHVDVRS